ncbi:MAG: hypothetical protein CL678_11715 [Bdellovibrionaceae bacterium]|nr:hypothetical protein [Pseudobdellovibrionaceae bacterium]|tara:strand:- start:589 stop:2559 length:1971 start_codon:yes stop_codon:yes gene_type:complete
MRFFFVPPGKEITTDAEFVELMERLASRPLGWEGRIALDTETANGISITDNRVVVWSLSDGEERWQLDRKYLYRKEFIDLWVDPERYWCFVNNKFDMHQLFLEGLPEIGGLPIDVISMAFINDENRSENKKYGMDEIASDYLGIKMLKFEATFGKGTNSEELMLAAPKETLIEYSTLDAYITWHLTEVLCSEISDLPFCDVSDYFDSGMDYLVKVEAPFSKTLWRMERRGIRLDPKQIDILEKDYTNRVQEDKKNMYRCVGRLDFNFQSPKQLKEYFFEELGLKPKSYTKSGNPSLSKEVLPLYAKDGVELAQYLIDYRKHAKLLATYIKGYFQKKITPQGKIHCNFRQHGTVTGRLSADNPNLQNIPGEQSFRAAFIPDKGMMLGCFDYGQVELRILGHFCQDPNLCTAFLEGLDLHSFTASKMLGVSYDEVMASKILEDVKISEEEKKELTGDLYSLSEQEVESNIKARKAAKTINFGILYGMSANKLAKTLKLTKDEAQVYLDGWFDAYPLVRDFIYGQVEKADTNLFHEVRSIQGRYRRLPKILSQDIGMRKQQERLAVNSTVQGSAGDIAKMAMIWLDRHPDLGGDCLEGGTYKVQLLLQVHDEIVVQCPKEHCSVVDAMIRRGLVQPPQIDISVPLVVDGGFSNNWGEAK